MGLSFNGSGRSYVAIAGWVVILIAGYASRVNTARRDKAGMSSKIFLRRSAALTFPESPHKCAIDRGGGVVSKQGAVFVIRSLMQVEAGTEDDIEVLTQWLAPAKAHSSAQITTTRLIGITGGQRKLWSDLIVVTHIALCGEGWCEGDFDPPAAILEFSAVLQFRAESQATVVRAESVERHGGSKLQAEKKSPR